MQNFSVAGLFFALRPGIIQPSEGKHGVQSEVIHLFLNPLRDSGYGEASPRVVCYNACVRVRVCVLYDMTDVPPFFTHLVRLLLFGGL